MLKVNKSEIDQLKEQAEEYKSFMATFKPQIEEFQREVNSLKIQLNNESEEAAAEEENNKKKGIRCR